jgi:MFS family permease
MTQSNAGLILILLVFSIAINYLDRGVLSVSAPLIARELSLSPTQLGLLLSAFFWSYAGFQLVAGWLVDRYPVKWVYAVGYAVWSLATAAVALAGSLPSLVAARLLLGMGESVTYPACSKILVHAFPEQRRGFANACVDAGSKVGPALSTLLGGLAVAQFGWRAVFIAVGLGSLLWLAPWLASTGGYAPQQARARIAGPGWFDLLRRRELWGTSLAMFALGYVWYFLLSWLPSYLVKERGFSMRTMAIAGSVPFWGMAAASLLGGWTSDRWIASGGDPSRVRKTYAVAGLLLCAAALLPSAMVRDVRLSVTLITVACLSLGLLTSNVWAITQTLAGPLAAGKWTGLQNAIGNLGGVLSPLLTGWVVARTGSFLLAFAAASAVLVAGASAYLTLVPEIRTLVWDRAPARTTVGA